MVNMATIAENLQTIKDSTDAIKQVIVDNGGDVSGGITTYADSINNIVNQEITFQFNYTKTFKQGNYTFTGTIDFGDNYPGPGTYYLYIDTSGLKEKTISSMSDTITFTQVYLNKSTLEFSLFVPTSFSTYVDPDDPGGASSSDITIDPNRKIYKVILNELV